MTIILRLLIVALVAMMSACSTHAVSLKYEPTIPLLPGAAPATVSSVIASDDRGTESSWLGAIRGGYGNVLKKLRTSTPTDEAVTEVLVDALRARNMLTPDASNKIIEVSIAKFDCSYYFNREAHAHMTVTVLALPTRSPLFSRTYKTDNVESGVGAGIFGDVKHLAGFAQRTLNQNIDKALADPALIAALSSSALPGSQRSVSERMRDLEELRKNGLISEAEFEAKRKALLEGL